MKTDINSYRLAGPNPVKALETEAVAQSQSGTSVRPPPLITNAKLSELITFKGYQGLFRIRLTNPLLRLFAQLTGLRLHIVWHGPADFHDSDPMSLICPMARRQACANSRQRKCCESCLRRRWQSALPPANQGRQFIGQCGVTNFCARVQADKFCPLTLILQARVAPHIPRLRPHASRQSFSRAAFQRAVALARLLLHDLESTAEARMEGIRLKNALWRLNITQTEDPCPNGELRPRLPDFPEHTAQPDLGSHARKLVDAMCDYVHQNYQRPINLKELASAMKMNASYLSALFSQTTGVPFHQFLEEVRVSKAKKLLRELRSRVREVANAVGYASPDAFRHAFKAHVGLSPEAWRAGQ